MRIALLLAVLAIGSCTNPLCGCSPPPQIAYVNGTLLSNSGAPLGGYRVLAERSEFVAGSCDPATLPVGERVTDPSGTFLIAVGGYFRDSVCVRFFARDTTPGSLQYALPDTVRLLPRYAPFDTVAVQLILSP